MLAVWSGWTARGYHMRLVPAALHAYGENARGVYVLTAVRLSKAGGRSDMAEHGDVLAAPESAYVWLDRCVCGCVCGSEGEVKYCNIIFMFCVIFMCNISLSLSRSDPRGQQPVEGRAPARPPQPQPAPAVRRPGATPPRPLDRRGAPPPAALASPPLCPRRPCAPDRPDRAPRHTSRQIRLGQPGPGRGQASRPAPQSVQPGARETRSAMADLQDPEVYALLIVEQCVVRPCFNQVQASSVTGAQAHCHSCTACRYLSERGYHRGTRRSVASASFPRCVARVLCLRAGRARSSEGGRAPARADLRGRQAAARLCADGGAAIAFARAGTLCSMNSFHNSCQWCRCAIAVSATFCTRNGTVLHLFHNSTGREDAEQGWLSAELKCNASEYKPLLRSC